MLITFKLDISYLGLWNLERYGWFKVSSIVILFNGLKWSILATKFIAYEGVSGLNQSIIDLVFISVTESIIVVAISEFKAKISSFLGFPVKLSILYSWLRVEFPGNIGFPISIYAIIHPTLHTSADLS